MYTKKLIFNNQKISRCRNVLQYEVCRTDGQ